MHQHLAAALSRVYGFPATHCRSCCCARPCKFQGSCKSSELLERPLVRLCKVYIQFMFHHGCTLACLHAVHCSDYLHSLWSCHSSCQVSACCCTKPASTSQDWLSMMLVIWHKFKFRNSLRSDQDDCNDTVLTSCWLGPSGSAHDQLNPSPGEVSTCDS